MKAVPELVARARLICGESHAVTDPAITALYRSDGRRREARARPPAPVAVILPGTGAEVRAVVGACAAAGVSWHARGAGTSLDGSALAPEEAVLIVLTRMRRVLRPHDADGEVTVEAGFPVAALARDAVSPWLVGAHPGATIGGHLAYAPLSATASAALSALEFVTRDGTHVHADRRAPGYDLAGAFCGSRGEAGIIVSVRLRLGSTTR